MYKTTEKVPLLSPDITSLRAGEIKPWLTTNQSLVMVCTQANHQGDRLKKQAEKDHKGNNFGSRRKQTFN